MPKAMARHILLKTEAEASQLKKRIANGEAFDVLAKKHSTCPSGKRGGPVKSQFGYHLVQVFYRD